MGRSAILLLVAITLLIPTVGFAQLSGNSFGFGIELGQLSSVHVSYAPVDRLQLSASVGPLNSISKSEYLKPSNVKLSSMYFLSDGRSSGFVGLDLFTADNRQFKYGVAVPVGMQYWVTPGIAFYGHLSTAKTDQMDSLTMFVGFGATFYLH